MHKIALAWVFGFAVIASAGGAAGLYLAGHGGGGDNEPEVVEAQETPTARLALAEEPVPTPIPGSPPAISRILLSSELPAVVATPIPRQSAPDVVPTPPPSPTPTPTATPTPEFGVCPTPVRKTPGDFAEPPPPVEPLGQRIEGSTSFAEGYVTVHLPAGRQFVIQTGQSSDVGGVNIVIYDIHAQSWMIIRGDGCETSRFVREAAADPVFDEVMRSLEIGSAYACPIPVRTTPEDLPVPDSLPPLPDRRVQGGVPFQLGPITLHLPAGREFVVGGGLADPGGEFFTVSDVQTRSGLFLRPDGCEMSRLVRDPAADAVLDQIVATLEVER